MPSRPEILRHIIREHRSMGLVPTELHMNAVTRAGFAEEAGIKPQTPKDTRSLANRLWSHQSPPETVLEFDGLRVVDNPKIEGGAIIIRPAQLMGDPNWLDNVIFRREEAIEQPQMPAEGTPWLKPMSEDVPAPQEVESGAMELLGRAGGASPTDVVMRAMDGMDKVADVVVLRFMKSGDVEMCASMDRMRILGALQIAMSYVAHGGSN